jgi:hypothetical protein
MNILQDNGMTPDQIATIGQEAKVDLGKPSAKPKADAQASPTADAGATDEPTADAPTADDPTADAPTADAPTADAPAGNTPTPTPKAVAKGDTMKAKDGKEYKWMGALWVDTATNKPIGIIPSMAQGLPNPKLDPIISAAKKDPALAKLIKSQVASKGVEAGTSGAQKAAQAGVQGTEKLDAKGVTA